MNPSLSQLHQLRELAIRLSDPEIMVRRQILAVEMEERSIAADALVSGAMPWDFRIDLRIKATPPRGIIPVLV